MTSEGKDVTIAIQGFELRAEVGSVNIIQRFGMAFHHLNAANHFAHSLENIENSIEQETWGSRYSELLWHFSA